MLRKTWLDSVGRYRIQNADASVHLTPQPSLVDQAYEAILGEIADGILAPNTHLIQKVPAARYGVSRHPI